MTQSKNETVLTVTKAEDLYQLLALIQQPETLRSGRLVVSLPAELTAPPSGIFVQIGSAPGGVVPPVDVVLRGPTPARTAVVQGVAFDVTARSLRIENVQLSRVHREPVRATVQTAFELRDSFVVGTRLLDARNPRVLDISVAPGSKADVLLERCVLTDSAGGIAVMLSVRSGSGASASVTIRDCAFVDDTPQAFVAADGTSAVVFEDSIVVAGEHATGVLVTSPATELILRSTMVACGGGRLVDASDAITVEGSDSTVYCDGHPEVGAGITIRPASSAPLLVLKELPASAAAAVAALRADATPKR